MSINLPNKKNTCVVIVTFNPDPSFINNLIRHSEIVEKVFIVDNNSDINIETLIPVGLLKNIEVIHSETNRGIAWALNTGIKQAQKRSYKWILTFDQDSLPNSNLLVYYSDVLSKEMNVGLIGTNFSKREVEVAEITWKNSLTVITSGTLHAINIFESLLFYNENLFIDGVDFDFALRVKLAGYKVIRVNESLLSHKLGAPVRKFGLESSNHNLVRRYYYSRNHVFLTKTYFAKFPLWIVKKNFFFIRSILILIIVEENIAAKLKIILKGIRDGCKSF